ncbi:MAG TPA: LLM class flavin-dependent oxidoreductase, partial [Anaerolineales bacterium]|nr:LLM class flavin-dependent oxidoreductase [Anaerolineales bacterium]
MKFGLLLLGEHPPQRAIRLARMAEDYGFEDLWFADEKFYRDPYVALASLANHTRSIRLGTCVTDPFTRHPALIAAAVASLDEASGGRAVLGLGAGFSGLDAMGVRRTKAVASLRRAIDLIRRLWSGETVSVEDEAFVLRQAGLSFAARGDIPILLASAGRQILRLAGEA